MKILHISAECYPAAKAGGLGDVVGALPKYLNKEGVETAVIMPKYRTKWLKEQDFEVLMHGTVRLGMYYASYAIEECLNEELGFTLYVVNCPQFFDRTGIYTDENGGGFRDDTERWLAFQQAVIHWILGLREKPKVLHCHDHHTGLIPFMIRHGVEYNWLADLPTVFTIHNGQYQGMFSWQLEQILPYYEAFARPLLDWAGAINPMASAIKCSWKFTTVSPGYLAELRANSGGLEWLVNNEIGKSAGILNGIDAEVWNPKTDKLLDIKLENGDIDSFKKKNKEAIAQKFGVRADLPLLTFIGRIVSEKGADLLPEVIGRYLKMGGAASFVILGTGDPSVSDAFRRMAVHFPDRFGCALEYNESVAHQLYAASDFLLMPSRVEPCGLNQMYAQRYGAVPIVRSVGGLRDTVEDIAAPSGGSGIRFDTFSVEEMTQVLHRAMQLWWDNALTFNALRQHIMGIDNSWEHSTAQYLALYREIAAV